MRGMDVSAQILVFLMTASIGVVMGLVYDIFRIARMALGLSRLGFVFDLLFWLCISPLFAAALYIASSLELRAYMFLGVILGMILYLFGLSVFIMRLARRIKKAARNFFLPLLVKSFRASLRNSRLSLV